MIATPSYGGNCSAFYKKSCVDLENFLTRANVNHVWLDLCNESLITRARNVIAKLFLKSKCDHLLFIDSDIEFLNEHVARLLTMADTDGVEIAVGACPTKILSSPFVVSQNCKLISIDDLPDEGPAIELDYAGSAFMLIKRQVFERLQEAHPDWEYQRNSSEGSVWAFFQDPVEDDILLSEDFFFCKRVRELGIKIMLHPSVQLGHWGSYRFNGQNVTVS